MSIARDERGRIGPGAPEFRVISFDVRAGGAVPVRNADRYPVVVGTGGPGALDPRLNDGVFVGSQGISEDPSWEAPLFRFLDRVLADERMSFLGICHSFGVLCRWAGAAEPVLRTPEKGGKSAGIVANYLTRAAFQHPWFGRLGRTCGGPRIEVLDSRLFDLLPTGRVAPLAFESDRRDTGPGEAITLIELAREPDESMPRIWGLNSHPEIGDRGLQRERLERLASRGEVSNDWIAERVAALDAWNHSARTEQHLQWATSYLFEGPVRRRLARAFREHGRRPD
jgi:hypothetical protein